MDAHLDQVPAAALVMPPQGTAHDGSTTGDVIVKDHVGLTDDLRVEDGFQQAIHRVAAVILGDGQLATVAPRAFHHHVTGPHGDPQRLLDDDVDARVERCMPPAGRKPPY